MKRVFATICMLVVFASAADITLSKDILRVYNNPVMSWTDGLTVRNSGNDTVWLDSAKLLFDEFDTTGLLYFIKNNTIQTTWLEMYGNSKSLDYTWTMGSLDGKSFRLERQGTTVGLRKSLTTAPKDSSMISRLQIGWCFICGSMPKYPRYLRGVLRLYFSSAAVVDIRLTSEDLRPGVPYEPCSDYACDSMNVRKILDRNGMDTVPVSTVSSVGSERIMGLHFGYLQGAEVTLPKPVTILPGEIGNLTALRSIGASGNSIDSISPAIGRCSNLTMLNMHNNGIQVLPDSIVRCSLLGYIDLDNNRLERVPDSIGKLKALRQLSIVNNHLTALPESMATIDSIDCVFIAGNRICSLSEGVKTWLERVRKLMHCARGEPLWPDSQECSVAVELTRAQTIPVAATVRILSKAGMFTVETGSKKASAYAVELIDISGRLVRRAAALQGGSGSTIAMSTCGLSQGMYLVSVVADGTVVYRQSVIVE